MAYLPDHRFLSISEKDVHAAERIQTRRSMAGGEIASVPVVEKSTDVFPSTSLTTKWIASRNPFVVNREPARKEKSIE